MLSLLCVPSALLSESTAQLPAGKPGPAAISTSSTKIKFGALDAGQSAETTLLIRNEGDAELRIISIDSDNQQFRVTPRGSLSISRGSALPVGISFVPMDYGPQRAVLTIRSSDLHHETLTVALSGEGPEQTTGTPVINPGGIVDGASFRPVLAPGGIASLFGSSLTGLLAAAADVPLPTELAGTQVEANGIPCPLFFISPQQINFQLPFEVATGERADLVVIRDGVSSEPESVEVAQFAPGIFVNPRTSEPVIQRHPDGSLITADNPATPGDVLIIYLTGIGGLDVEPETGSAASASPLSFSLVTPAVTLGESEANVVFAGLTPESVGLAQVNAVLPVELVALSEVSRMSDSSWKVATLQSEPLGSE